MNYQYPYTPDSNHPPGIPRGYPSGAPPLPTSNPLLPHLTANASMSDFPSVKPCYNMSSSYPSITPYLPSNSPYPPDNRALTHPCYSTRTTFTYDSAAPFYRASKYCYSAISPSSRNPYSAPNRSPYPSSPPSPPSRTPYPSSPPSPPSRSPYPSSVPSHANSSPYPGMYSGNPTCNPSQYLSYGPSYPATAAHSGGIAGYPPNSSGLNMSGPSAAHRRPYPEHPTMAQYCMYEGTVKPYPDFVPQKDAEALRKAMKGFGTDEKAIINVLAKRSNAQRIYIAVAFKQLYGKDLIDDLKSELSGNFEDVIIALMTPTNDYLASEVRKAISGIGTDEDVLIEVLCTRTNQEIWAINESYQRLFGKNMEDDIRSDTSGHFQRLLVSTVTGARSEASADETRAQQNAHALYAAGVGQWGTDESVFNSILVAESFQQLALTFYEYQKLAGHTVVEAIEKEMSGDVKKGMLAIAQCVENRPLYFAQRLYKAMKGLGTDDRTLIRIIVSRCEMDMIQIKAEYERHVGKPLADAIHGDTSGDYRRVLVALVDGY